MAYAKIHGVVDIQVAPALVRALCRIVVFVVRRPIGIGQSAVGVDAVLQLLVLITDVEEGPRRPFLVGEPHVFCKDVAVVVGIGDGIGRLATIIACGVAVCQRIENGEGALV